jgi:hypothetical protein
MRLLHQLIRCIEVTAALCIESEEPSIAVRLLAAAEVLRNQIGSVIWPVDRPAHERHITEARAALGDAAFDAAWQAGRLLTWEQATDEALAWLETYDDVREAAR